MPDSEKQHEKIIGIYHKDCIDGTATAAVLLKRFPDIEFFPLKRGYDDEDFDPILNYVDKETVVYIGDFSLERDNYEKLLARAKKVINLDHHMSAQEHLEKIAEKYKNFALVFDNKRSGASLVWEYFYGRKSTPELILLIEDGDIGKFEFPKKTKHSGGVLMPLMNKPSEILKELERPLEKILKEGKTVTDFMDFILEAYQARNKPLTLRIGKYDVLAYNATFNVERMRSTLGKNLAEKHGAAIALFRISGDEVTFSFRGLESAEPSSLDVAEQIGGGGHRNAAGGAMPLADFCKIIVFE